VRVICRLVAVLAPAVACGSTAAPPPMGQVVIHVDTDAPVPNQTPNPSTDWTAPIPLFDRLRFDVYRPGDMLPCDACTNDVAVTEERLASGAVSFGVVPVPDESGWIARIRLSVRRFETSVGDLDQETTIDRFVSIPAVAEGQVVDVSVMLSTDDTGRTVGSLDAPTTPALGAPTAGSRVGTWSRAARTACTSKAPRGAACVPGGAFWMGAPRDHLVAGTDQTWHRLVVLSPFWLEQTEVTVTEAREGGLSAAGVWSGSTAGTSYTDYCTYTLAGSRRDVLPVNCVYWSVADEFCKGAGGRLPTEGQLEYVGGGALSLDYPWGNDLPSCTEAVWGRNGFGLYYLVLPSTCLASTNFLAPLGGPEPPMTGSRDVLPLPSGNVHDLAGNLYELARDTWQSSSDPCWSPEGVLQDPVCTLPSTADPAGHAVRGGSWSNGATYLETSHRLSFQDDIGDPEVGFRCAWPGG
jgi:sulfatase modifying factor 1